MVRLLRQSTAATKTLHVKVKPLKLEGVCREKMEDEKENIVVLKMKWKGSKSRLVPFYRSSTCQRNYSSPKFLRKGKSVEWDEEFESICNVWVDSKDNSFDQWDVSFHVLYGKDAESRTKMEVLGKVSINIAEMASKMDSKIERKLPISLQIDGVIREATLLIGVSFAEVRNFHGSPAIVKNSVESGSKEGNFKTGKGQIASASGRKKKDTRNQASSSDSDELSSLSDGLSGNELIATGENSSAQLRSSPGSRTRADSVSKAGLFSWKKRNLSLKFSRRKEEPLTERTSVNDNDEVDINLVDLRECNSLQKEGRYGSWEVKEVVSRNGQAKLKSNVFFASFDQRSEKAAGESACTALVAVIAHWLHSNQHFMPTISQFDSLITEGSSEWRKLCNDKAYMNSFPDNHFDLETVLKADLRPLAISHDRSFTGIFSPEKFKNLKGFMSFDDIWVEMIRITEDYDRRIYIVSWNDHFFVLKVEADAYYIIDSLGERLFEGCNQAYILKFDDSSLMYGKLAQEEDGSEEMAEADKDREEKEKGECEVIICKGKECCKEFIKRFLAAIPLEELEKEEKRGMVSTFSLLQKLQIDFHYCCSSASLFSSPTSTISSIFSDERCI